MNILYLSADPGIPIRGFKGASVHVRALTDALVRQGHAVTILTSRPGPPDGPAPLAELLSAPLPEKAASSYSREEQAMEAAGALYASAQGLLARQRFDFVYERYSLWSNLGARLSRETGLPLVLEVNAPLRLEAAQYRNVSDSEAAAQTEEEQFTAAQAISVVSDSLRGYAVSRGASPDRAHVLPNAVDPDRFHPAARGGAVRDRWDLNGRTVVGFVGKPRPWHDLGTLLRAFGLLHATDARYHLLLVGEMPEGLPTQLKVLKLEEATTLTGPVPHDEVPEHIAAMDVAVSPHPPLRDFYFSPLKLFEYLACGVPTVAAEVGQPAEIIRNGETGYLYPPGDAEALASRIRALVDHPDHAREVAWQGATYMLENHTWEGNARAVVGWIEQMRSDESRQGWDSCGMRNQSVGRPPCQVRRLEALPVLDSKLRQRLYRATRPDLAGPLLARRLPAFWKKGPEEFVEVGDIEVLKYKPGRRCVLGYELRGRVKRDGRPSRHWVIGKVYRDERGLRLFQLQQRMWADGFGPDAPDRIHVPRPLAYIPEMRMLAQVRAAGATLNDLIGEGNVGRLVERSARGLAKLHGASAFRSAKSGEPATRPAAGLLETYLLQDELENLDLFTEEILETRPDSQPAIAPLRDALQAWGRRLPRLETPAPVHRDFYYSQVLFDGPRVTLIDFDLLALGDPAVDVANFAAHLYFLGLDRLGRLDALAGEADSFVEAYGLQRDLDDSFLQRLAFYQAATFFRLMKVVAPRPALARHFEPLRRETERRLEAA